LELTLWGATGARGAIGELAMGATGAGAGAVPIGAPGATGADGAIGLGATGATPACGAIRAGVAGGALPARQRITARIAAIRIIYFVFTSPRLTATRNLHARQTAAPYWL
jgi:hypothetical protein